ncbi:MAG: DUF4236 domain-containing protein [Syntrophothermus sp.]|uniref:DUF4236 domain-containing protein n=1 Tax=Syntrophothermus sp. TaxID=2736299 RepID=UPI00257A045D|nr:DUF4236 domain-containing protein [Syntrophothermus sp.]NSW84216.1 DUF4236 domain-containing protein [Syntrophothermus sp.]
MGWRFRKSIKIAKGVRLNLSKRGLGVSVGGKGFRVGIGPRGAYTSASIPGTGLYSINYFGKRKSRDLPKAAQKASAPPEIEGYNVDMPPELAGSSTSTALGCLWFLISVMFLFIWWPLGVAGIVSQIAWSARSFNSPTGKAKNYFLQGKMALQKGEWQPALEAFLKVLEVKPEVNSLCREVAFLYRRLDNPEEAVKYFEKYLASYPEDAVTRLNYAVTLGTVRQYQKAIEVLQGLPLEMKEELAVINALASAFLGLNKPELALEVLEKGPVRSRKSMDEQMKLFRYLLGLTYKQLGETEKALKQFYKIYAEDTDYEDVRDLLKELNPSFGG